MGAEKESPQKLEVIDPTSSNWPLVDTEGTSCSTAENSKFGPIFSARVKEAKVVPDDGIKNSQSYTGPKRPKEVPALPATTRSLSVWNVEALPTLSG